MKVLPPAEGTMREYGWLAITVALSLTGPACLRTPMAEQQEVTMNTSGTGGTGGGTTGTMGGAGGSPDANSKKCATNQNTCATDDDCTIGDYRPPISSAADCYCFICGYPVSKTMAADCESAYNQFCGPNWNWQTQHNCPVPPCPLLRSACIAGMCQISH
jgi:hypothetical protein